MNADQIYAKAKETDKQMNRGGTYPDLAMSKGLELVNGWSSEYSVKSSSSTDPNELKRVIHKNMFACVNMMVTRDIYDLDPNRFVYEGYDKVAGGHSMVCCGYDEESKMFIFQNHWGTIWGLKGFFLCPYNVWKSQCNLFCWYERNEQTKRPKTIKETKKENTPVQPPQEPQSSQSELNQPTESK